MNIAFVLTALLLSGEDPDCWYTPWPTTENPAPEMAQAEGCLVLEVGHPVLAPAHRERIALEDQGIGWLVAGRQFYYTRADGSLLPVLTYDNGPDPWSEGLTRAWVEGKVAYYDRAFQQVIAPEYDWGWPFKDGRARVCRGCVLEAPDGDGHRAVTGGEWRFIDRSGKVVRE